MTIQIHISKVLYFLSKLVKKVKYQADRFRRFKSKNSASEEYESSRCFYQFRAPKDGYLVDRRNLNPVVREAGGRILALLNYIDNKIEENSRANKLILESLGLPLNSEINELNSFYKREFRKKKYLQKPTKKSTLQLPEPKKYYEYFLPSDIIKQAKSSSLEFLRSFRSKD